MNQEPKLKKYPDALVEEFLAAVLPVLRANATEEQYKKARDLLDRLRGTK